MSFKINQPVALVKQAQAAIKEEAEQRGYKRCLGELTEWLIASQNYSLFMMNCSTGEDFRKHCAQLEHMATAYQAVQAFIQEKRG